MPMCVQCLSAEVKKPAKRSRKRKLKGVPPLIVKIMKTPSNRTPDSVKKKAKTENTPSSLQSEVSPVNNSCQSDVDPSSSSVNVGRRKTALRRAAGLMFFSIDNNSNND